MVQGPLLYRRGKSHEGNWYRREQYASHQGRWAWRATGVGPVLKERTIRRRQPGRKKPEPPVEHPLCAAHCMSFSHPHSNPLKWYSFLFITELISTGQNSYLWCDSMSLSHTKSSICHNSSEQTHDWPSVTRSLSPSVPSSSPIHTYLTLHQHKTDNFLNSHSTSSLSHLGN